MGHRRAADNRKLLESHLHCSVLLIHKAQQRPLQPADTGRYGGPPHEDLQSLWGAHVPPPCRFFGHTISACVQSGNGLRCN
ncbi:hypothetical protein GDO78_021264 [Eleutherodactylus coqui]|uniref:Uncharacterized protein n=1 Tax=Eleutherodactylus coqui TaxID=57060 RepID=A0A8J6E2U3_ELECQ|nr:hypothetical protein GDO78_021264 [Eleutherodactylus coqui]